MLFFENIKVALQSVKANFLRSLLTLLIIAVGITCLVGILTAIDTLLFTMSDSFNRLGANSFNIRPKYEEIESRKNRSRRARSINYAEAIKFKETMDLKSTKTSVFLWCGADYSLKFGDKKTNPTVRQYGIDENYLITSAYNLSHGRNLSYKEANQGAWVCIVGSEIVDLLFNGKAKQALGQSLSTGTGNYQIIGILESKGSTINDGADRRIFIPIQKAKQAFGTSNTNYSISTLVSDPTLLNGAISSATGMMRNIRKLNTIDKNDFTITKSDGVMNRLKDMTSQLRIATIFIALLTLTGASIGLMNIMLVSVTERTREIGIRKALGATSNQVLTQFLVEALVICILGGIVGIILGVGMGFIVAYFIEGSFLLPINWMILGIVVCVVVGVVAGLYPAMKAARLDPIESLRFE